ncbi:hypothetical protein C1645_549079 [Glomus cerebriforme]|uniref:Uncharacterized protein n=1 Tax=Glomus cerebriforme TaxID=658196 RepID=A0A397TDR9_9GLOM|nr:hypothetical protein C1645_549079 [Glomus cerebriforme]
MENTHRKKADLEIEKASREDIEHIEGSEDGQPTNKLGGFQQFVVNHREDLNKFEGSYENLHKQSANNNEENRHIDSREQQYNEETCDNSKALNKRTVNKMQFTNYNEDNQYCGYQEQQYENYEDKPRNNLQFVINRGQVGSSTFRGQNQYIDPREQQQRYNERWEDQRRNSCFSDTRNSSEQEDGGPFPHLFRKQRKIYDNKEEDSESDLRQFPTRIYSQYSNESRDNVYTHIKDRKQYVYDYTYDNFEESDHIEDRDYREELNSSNQSINSRQDYPIWKDIKVRKSYLRKRNYNVQEPVLPKPKPIRSGNIGREIPFILGTGTGKSHSVTVNLQKAFALLKNHNPNSCSVCNNHNTKNINASDKNKFKKPSSEKEESPDIALGRVIGIIVI